MRRRLTPEQQDRNDEQAQERYDELYAQIEDEQREEHEREFGHSFKPNGARIHAAVMQRMK